MPTTVPSTSKNWPATRLQTALSSLGFYTGPINGEMDDATKHSLSAFSACVSPTIKAKFGTGVAAMAEAAARHEFALGAKHCSIPTSTKPD
ncbi:MAG: peptidoglycan-binding domain-containing protein [Rhodospirillaceae bacterium]